MTPFPGLRVGHATDARLRSGVTVFIPDAPAVAAVHVAGGAPATRETDLLRPGTLVETVDAIVLSGGSAFGLAAADGAMAALAAAGRGFAVADVRVPIVPAACLFDLANGGDKSSLPPASDANPYRELGLTACAAATPEFGIGSVGAGTGATTADLKGGFGAAQTVVAGGARLAAFVAVNAVGRVTLGDTPHFRAAPFEVDGEFGGLGLPQSLPADAAEAVVKGAAAPRLNTTLAVVVTNAALDCADAQRLAIAAHDGMALAIYPAHTPFDGDTVFTMATGSHELAERAPDLAALCAAATATLARAIAVAVYAASSTPDDRVPTWRQRHCAAAPAASPIDAP